MVVRSIPGVRCGAGRSLWALHCWSPGLASNPPGGHAAGGGIGLDQGVRMQVC